MTGDMQVDQGAVVDALRERINHLVYENALLAAAVAQLQRDLAEARRPVPPA